MSSNFTMKIISKTTAIALFTLAGSSVNAETLVNLLSVARNSEPNYQAAKANFDMAIAKRDQAYGALFPQVSISVNTIGNNREYQTRNSAIPEQNDNYRSDSAQINMTHPLIRPANVFAYKQSDAVVFQALNQLEAADQELIAKLSQAWFEWMGAQDAVQLTERQVASSRRQLELVERGEQLGTHGQPQVQEARMAFEQANADLASSQADMYMKMANLEQLTGIETIQNSSRLNDQAALPELEVEPLDQWLLRLDQSNPNLAAAMRALDAASYEVSKQKAGHVPTLDVVASYGKNGQAVGSFPGQAGFDITQGTAGFQLNVPVYSGGTQSAKVKEAAAQKFKAQSDVNGVRRQGVLAIKQAWYSWAAGKARAAAGRQSMLSAASAYNAARRGFDLGSQSELDVLQADQQLMVAQRDFNKGRYDQLLAWVRLKASAGLLNESDVLVLDNAMKTASSDTEKVSAQIDVDNKETRNTQPAIDDTPPELELTEPVQVQAAPEEADLPVAVQPESAEAVEISSPEVAPEATLETAAVQQAQ